MNIGLEIARKKANVRVARMELDQSIDQYRQALFELEKALTLQIEAISVTTNPAENTRQPKDKIRDLIRVAYNTRVLTRARFPEIKDQIQKMSGTDVSASTLRQNLYRMLRDKELERYAGQWGPGRQLKS